MFSELYQKINEKVRKSVFFFNFKFIPCSFAPTNMLTNLLFSFNKMLSKVVCRDDIFLLLHVLMAEVSRMIFYSSQYVNKFIDIVYISDDLLSLLLRLFLICWD